MADGWMDGWMEVDALLMVMAMGVVMGWDERVGGLFWYVCERGCCSHYFACNRIHTER